MRYILYVIAAIVFILAFGWINEQYERARASWWADEFQKMEVGGGK